MKQLLNTLFVQTQGAYLRLDHETIKLEVERETKLQVPLHHLGGLAVFGNVLLSPFLLHRFCEDGRSVVWFGRGGRFKARLAGPRPAATSCCAGRSTRPTPTPNAPPKSPATWWRARSATPAA